MGDENALDTIEADIQFCEDVLNYKGQLPSGRDRADLHTVGRHRSTAAEAASSGQYAARSPASKAPPGPPAVAERHKAKQPAYPISTKTSLQQQPEPSLAQPPVKPRNIEELWAVLESAPTGQPVEIDTGLLYGHDSSNGGASSPSGSSRGSQAGSREQLWQANDDFLLPAYRPSSTKSEAGEGLGLGNAKRRPRQQPEGSTPSSAGKGRMHHGSRSPAAAWHDSPGWHPGRPGSTPQQQRQQDWQPYDEQQVEGEVEPRSASGRSSTQPSHRTASAAGHAQGETEELLRQGRQERLQQLAQPRTHLWQQCAERRAEQADAELADCTFVPRTGRPPSRTRLAPAGLPVEDRLLAAKESREEALARARKELATAEVAECTFAPQLVTKPQHHLHLREHRPLHQRLGEEQRRRSSKLAQARLLEDMANPDLTFQPQLNQRSLAMAAAKEERDLFSPGPMRRPCSTTSAKSPSAAAAVGGAEQGCTFSPTINPSSKQFMEDSERVPSDFQERQRFYMQKRQQAAQRAAAAAGAGACTFHPDTGNAVEVLAQSALAGHLLETEDERCQRMAQEEAARREQRRLEMQAEVYGGLHFQPQLNQRSLAMAKGQEGLPSAEKRWLKLQALQEAEEERRRAECTFRPDTSKPRVMGYYSEYEPPQPSAQLSIAQAAKQGFEGLTQRIAEYQAQKEARATAVRQQAEQAELAQCSFSPNINRSSRLSAAGGSPGAVVVPGLDRFLELKQLASQQRREAEERAAKVFLQSPQGGALAHGRRATLPKPFRLAGQALLEAKAQQKREAVQQDVLAAQLEACTFRPTTNVARRKQLLDSLLQSYDDDPVEL